MASRPTDCLVAPAIRLNKGEGLAEALRCLREFDPHIFLVFGGDAEDVKWLHETLEDQAKHPILFCADLERGAGQQFEGLTPLPDAWALGLLGPEAAYDAGHRTAVEAASAGVRWILGPVLDLHRIGPDAVNSPIIGHRAFGGDIERVIETAGAWLRGLTDGGGIACGKHFPGHGACPQDSHVEHAVSFEEPERHLEPFKALLDRLPTMMVGHIEFPMFDPEGLPASRSKKLMGILRDDWKYDGLVVADALRMAGYGDGPHDQLAIESLYVGVDVLLDPEDPVTLAVSLRDALERGDLDPAVVERAASRVRRLLDTTAETPVANPRPLMLGAGAKRLLRPLPGGSPGRQIPRPGVALALAGSPDARRFLEEHWGVEVLNPGDSPPSPLPDAVLILWGAAMGRGLPPIPSPWLEALHHSHPIVYIAGSPDATELAPASLRGLYLPGLSPALLSLLFATGEE
ncbi:MAG TPA: glycoside hydrolase family 3 N-terminal domain-containing protein [Planctomycetota bacterium]